MTTKAKAKRRAIGIVRVSEFSKDREDAGKTREEKAEDNVSLAEQRKRIREAAERDNLELIEIIPEPEVSGGTPLEKRDGLRRAIEAVEAGEAKVIIAAYFDRLVRSLRVQDELVSRVEAADGQVLAVDVGQVTNGSAGQWLSGTMLGAVAEYHRRTTAERSREAQAAAIARGVAPWPGASLGYKREVTADGKLGKHVPDPETKDAVAEAFERRADGASISEVREHLRERGVDASYNQVQKLLGSRTVLGEIHFGSYEPNLDAHTGIVDRDVWQRAQRVRVPRGRKPKSNRLLARLRLLRCATCGSALSASVGHGGTYPIYQHAKTTDCENPGLSISAELIETIVSDYVKAKIADVEGQASAEALALNAITDRDAAQAKLDAAIRTLADLTDEPATIETIAKLRAARDEAQEEVDRLGGESVVERVRGAADWDKLTFSEKRDLLKIHAPRVTVAPGRGAERVTIQALGE